MVGAGLLARHAVERGLSVPAHVKTSLAPGSRVVTRYLKASGLDKDLEALGFHTVGYGCTTCIGNSGPLLEPIEKAIEANDLVVCSVLSGNRNFEGRVHPLTRANFLASPPLVVAYALAGRVDLDFEIEALGLDREGRPVYLRDIWPGQEEVRSEVAQAVHPRMFAEEYANVFSGNEIWNNIRVPAGEIYNWDEESTYIRRPTFFADLGREAPAVEPIAGARVPGQARRQRHHRPYFAGGVHRRRESGGPIPGKPRGRAARLEQLRLAPWKPRGNDARYLCQYPHPERIGARSRGRAYSISSQWRADVDLRGG